MAAIVNGCWRRVALPLTVAGHELTDHVQHRASPLYPDDGVDADDAAEERRRRDVPREGAAGATLQFFTAS